MSLGVVQASHIPNINPANPGKLINFAKHPELVGKFPDQFTPFRAFDCDFTKPFEVRGGPRCGRVQLALTQAACVVRATGHTVQVRAADTGASCIEPSLHASPLRRIDACALVGACLAVVHTLLPSCSPRNPHGAGARLQEFVREAASMLPFLKSVECIEVLEFPATAGPADAPHLLFSCGIHPPTLSRELRAQRAFVKRHPTMGRVARVDFELVIQARLTARGRRTLGVPLVEEVGAGSRDTGTGAGAGVGAGAGAAGAGRGTGGTTTDSAVVSVERWLVCNQWCGDGLDEMGFFGPATAHLRLVPWAGVAALLARGDAGAPDSVVGTAYCSLPLPIHTGLPVHVRWARLCPAAWRL